MLKLRLQRRGKKNYATYRVVVADQRAPIKGKFVADVGFYNPHTNEFKVDAEKITEWLSKGTQASSTVHNLLIDNKIIKGEKVTSWRPKVKESEEEESKDKTGEAKEDKKEEPADKTEEKADTPDKKEVSSDEKDEKDEK
jgi:small subunit ribosomal protein S16